jgi:hypothetical protein
MKKTPVVAEPTEDEYRQARWRDLMTLVNHASERPGYMATWKSDDGQGYDIEQLKELMDDWRESDPENAGQFEFDVPDHLTFNLWVAT